MVRLYMIHISIPFILQMKDQAREDGIYSWTKLIN